MDVALHKNKSFYWLMGGNLASFAGAQVYLIALPLVVLSLTGSAVAMGTVAAIGQATAWLQPLIGPLVDRFSRKTLLMISDLMRAFVLLMISVLYFADFLLIFHLFIASFIIGMFTQLYNTAQFAIIPKLVKKEDLPLANTIESSLFHTTILIGPTLGGLLIALVNPGIGLVVNSIGFFIAFVTVLLIQLPKRDPAISTKEKQRFFSEVADGFHFIFKRKILLLTNLSNALISFGITISLTLLVFHLQATVGLTSIEIGWLLSIGGAAAIAGSFLSVSLRKIVSQRTILIFGFLGGSLSLIWLGLAQSYTLLIIANAVGTFSAASFNPVLKTIRQRLTPDHLLGRVQACSRFITMALFPLAAIIAGFLGDYIGTHVTIAIGGAIASCSVFIFLHPEMRSLR